MLIPAGAGSTAVSRSPRPLGSLSLTSGCTITFCPLRALTWSALAMGGWLGSSTLTVRVPSPVLTPSLTVIWTFWGPGVAMPRSLIVRTPSGRYSTDNSWGALTPWTYRASPSGSRKSLRMA